MSDYAATVLDLTPIGRRWQEVASMVFSYLKREHEPFPSPPTMATQVIVDARTRCIMEARKTGLVEKTEPELDGKEHWRSFSAELWFGGRSCFIYIRLREADRESTQLEVWFPSEVHEVVFNFDPDCRDFASTAKSDLVRLMIGLAKTFDCLGFAYRLASGENVFGPPGERLLRDYIEIGDRWLGHADPLIMAAIDARRVEETDFAFDLEDNPMHYRQNGYYLYDILWPRP